MGCGSSSLKGDKVEGVGESDLGPPARKVKTNFSDIDFSSNASADRRGTVSVAPDEHRRPTKVSEASAEGVPDLNLPAVKENADMRDEDGAKLQPYRSNDDGTDGLLDPMDQKIKALQPTSAQDTTPQVLADTQPKSVGDSTHQA